MLLKDLFFDTNIHLSYDQENLDIKNISVNSRNITPDSLFLAYKGIENDSHKYIDDAYAAGAKIVIGTEDLSHKYGEKYIRVENSREIWSLICINWFGRPTDFLKFIGVTGTDGKTTTCALLYSILKEAGWKVAQLSTIVSPGLHTTTPDAYNLQKVLADFVKEGIEWVVLETTSEGLFQKRVYGINYEISGLTNITPEHLYAHGTFENYVFAKSQLFAMSKFSVLPDDEIGHMVAENQYLSSMKKEVKDFLYKEENVYFYSINDFPEEVKLQIVGDFNIKNCALATSICRHLNIDEEVIKKGLESVKDIKGRWEIMYMQEYGIVIDFAHTTNALENVLSTAKQFMEDKGLSGKLIHIFGCAGERDVLKREPMGEVSGKYADITILTSEDPRRESLKDIDAPIVNGLQKSGMHYTNDYSRINGREYFILNWRGSAISYAIKMLLKEGDLLLITGKGHEESMCFGKTEYTWTDQDCVKVNLEEIGKVQETMS